MAQSSSSNSTPPAAVASCLNIIQEALEKVEPAYFDLPTTYSAGIHRERVLAYELYHQMRCLPTDENLHPSLHGEINKSGHSKFTNRQQEGDVVFFGKGVYEAGVDPDFVFHKAGTMKENTLVVELKVNLRVGGICKDFATLTKFICRGYQAGAFVLCKHSFEELRACVNAATRELAAEPTADKIHILTMKKAGGKIEEHRFSELKP